MLFKLPHNPVINSVYNLLIETTKNKFQIDNKTVQRQSEPPVDRGSEFCRSSGWGKISRMTAWDTYQ